MSKKRIDPAIRTKSEREAERWRLRVKEANEDVPSLSDAETVTGVWTFTAHPLGLDHTKIANIGVLTHAQLEVAIASHTGDASLHVPAHLLVADPHTQYQQESEKGVASGYASLETDIKVTAAQLRNPIWIGVSAPDPTLYPLWLDTTP